MVGVSRSYLFAIKISMISGTRLSDDATMWRAQYPLSFCEIETKIEVEVKGKGDGEGDGVKIEG